MSKGGKGVMLAPLVAAGHLEPGLGKLQCSVGGVDYFAGAQTWLAAALSGYMLQC